MKIINDKITFMGTFKNKDLELSFQAQTFAKIRKYLFPCIMSVLAIYLLFSIPYLINSSLDTFLQNFTLRFSTIILFYIIYFAFGRFKNYRSYILTITIYEFIFSILYIFLISRSLSINFAVECNFAVKCLDIVIFLTIYFLFPNKWFHSFSASVFLLALFSLYTIFYLSHFVKDTSYLPGSVYLAIIFILNAFNSYRTGYYKRLQFYDNLMLQNLLNIDTLTGAYTRIKFDEEIKNQIAIAEQMEIKLSIAIFDIDNFKRINDTYGHLEGDKILTGIVEIINENKRPRDILTRWGGEEFVILFPSTSLENAAKISERHRHEIADFDFSIGEHVTCSFGVTEYCEGDTPVTILRRADKLLYTAKASGKNVVVSGCK